MPGPTRQFAQLTHNEDYSWWTWKGESYYLSPMPAEIIKILYRRHCRRQGPIHFKALMKQAGSESYQTENSIHRTEARLKPLFKGASHKAWGKLIIRVAPGRYMLNPEIPVPPRSRKPTRSK